MLIASVLYFAGLVIYLDLSLRTRRKAVAILGLYNYTVLRQSRPWYSRVLDVLIGLLVSPVFIMVSLFIVICEIEEEVVHNHLRRLLDAAERNGRLSRTTIKEISLKLMKGNSFNDY